MSVVAEVIEIKGGQKGRQKALQLIQSNTSPWSISGFIGESASNIADGHKRFTYSDGDCVTSVTVNDRDFLVLRLNNIERKVRLKDNLNRGGLNGGLVQGHVAELAKQLDSQMKEFQCKSVNGF